MWSPVRRRIFDNLTDVSRSPARALRQRAPEVRGPGARRQPRAAGGRCRFDSGGGRRRGARRRGRRGRLGPAPVGVDVVEHVLAGDPSTRTGSFDLAGVDAVLVHETPHDRRQQPSVGGCGGSPPVAGAGAGSGRAAASGAARRRAVGGGRGRLGSRRGGGSGRGRWRRGRLRRWRVLGRRCRIGSRRRRRWSRLGRWRRRCGVGGGGALVADHGDHRADVDRLAFGDADLGHHAGDRRGHLGVDLVRGDLEQRLIGGDGVADLLEPLRDRALGDGLTELWERDVSHVCVWCLSDQPLKSRPVSESIVSPNSSDRLGWGWMNSATSATVASQFTAK